MRYHLIMLLYLIRYGKYNHSVWELKCKNEGKKTASGNWSSFFLIIKLKEYFIS